MSSRQQKSKLKSIEICSLFFGQAHPSAEDVVWNMRMLKSRPLETKCVGNVSTEAWPTKLAHANGTCTKPTPAQGEQFGRPIGSPLRLRDDDYHQQGDDMIKVRARA